MTDKRFEPGHGDVSFAHMVKGLVAAFSDGEDETYLASVLDRHANTLRQSAGVARGSSFTIEPHEGGLDAVNAVVYDATGEETLFADIDDALGFVEERLGGDFDPDED